jgi:transposase-like protein
MKYCPCCFLSNKLSSLSSSGQGRNQYWDCPVCASTFVWPSTLISEEVVRTFIQQNKPKYDAWLDKLI